MLAGGFTINCDIIVPDKANGAQVATGSNLDGWSFALRNGRPIATHAASSAEADQFSIQASAPLPAGTQNLGFVFIPDSTKPGSRSEEHTSELQSLMRISYAVFCLKKKKQITTKNT